MDNAWIVDRIIIVENNVRHALLAMLRAGLWNMEIDDTGCFPLTAGEWGQLMLLARQQTVPGIVFRGIGLMPECFMPPVSELARWMVAVDDIENAGRNMNLAVISLFDEFSSVGIAPVLLKGQGVALFYEEPLFRESGDIDLYFCSEDERIRAEKLVSDRKIKIVGRPDGSSYYNFNGVIVEHHSGLLDFRNDSICRLIIREKGSGWIETVRIAEGGQAVDVCVPCPELNIVMLNFHILKHAMGHGVGLRQLCDMARAYHSLSDRIDRKLLSLVFKKAGIAGWNRLLHSSLVWNLGMDIGLLDGLGIACSSADNKLMDIVWSGGNFGQHRSGAMSGDYVFRKLSTFLALFGKMAFGLKYAPCEYAELVSSLVRGQLKK